MPMKGKKFQSSVEVPDKRMGKKSAPPAMPGGRFVSSAKDHDPKEANGHKNG